MGVIQLSGLVIFTDAITSLQQSPCLYSEPVLSAALARERSLPHAA